MLLEIDAMITGVFLEIDAMITGVFLETVITSMLHVHIMM